MAKKPTEIICDALNELCSYNDRTIGAETDAMLLGKDIFIVTLKRPRIIDGEWEDVDRTVDMEDLIDAHKNEKGWW